MAEFPPCVLRDRFCVGLNDACRLFDIGPVAFTNSLDFIEKLDRRRVPVVVVKGRLQYQSGAERTDNHCRWDDPERYVFSYRDNRWDSWDHFDADALWKEPDFFWNVPGGCSAVFALQFVLLAGAKSVTFVGCDSCRVGGLNYPDRPDKRQRYHVKRRMPQYASGVLRVALSARTRFPGVPILSLVPFFGLGYHEEQYAQMREASGVTLRKEYDIRRQEHRDFKVAQKAAKRETKGIADEHDAGAG